MLAQKTMTISDALSTFSRSAPIDVDGLADALGLTVVQKNFPNDISGKIEKNWLFDGYTISVNTNHARTRQRFTIAHEIAHFILHRDKIGDGITDNGLYRSDRGDYVEREANAYAATILMPAPMVISTFGETNRSVEAIAKVFDVSYAVAEIRLRELHLNV